MKIVLLLLSLFSFQTSAADIDETKLCGEKELNAAQLASIAPSTVLHKLELRICEGEEAWNPHVFNSFEQALKLFDHIENVEIYTSFKDVKNARRLGRILATSSKIKKLKLALSIWGYNHSKNNSAFWDVFRISSNLVEFDAHASDISKWSETQATRISSALAKSSSLQTFRLNLRGSPYIMLFINALKKNKTLLRATLGSQFEHEKEILEMLKINSTLIELDLFPERNADGHKIDIFEGKEDRQLQQLNSDFDPNTNVSNAINSTKESDTPNKYKGSFWDGFNQN